MITFHTPKGTLSLPVPDGGTLLDLLRAAGLSPYAPCDGRGICGGCKVTYGAGAVRLACQIKPENGMEFWYAPPEGRLRVLTEGDTRVIKLCPAVEKRVVTLPSPSLSDQRPDDDRLSAALGLPVPFELLKDLPDARTVTAVIQDGALTGLEPGDSSDRLCGAAVDIGTTTLAGYLYDLTDGRCLARAGTLNPQRVHGADVCARMDFAARDGGASILRQEIRDGVRALIGRLCAEAGRPEEEVCRVVLAGNTVMLHLLLGFDTRKLAVAPFLPVSVRAHSLPAAALGLNAGTGARAVTLPCVAAYVGADTVAAVLAAGMDDGGETSLLIDLGTNGEIVLRHGGRLYACSAAAGPAFEGGNISCGLPGIDGAIDRYTLDGGPQTIGGAPPAGLCGAGLVDVAAELLRGGLMDETGRLLEGNTFTVAPGVTLTQADIRALQSAKAAVAAGTRVLLQTAGISSGALDALYLAGGFGACMDARNAMEIGLLPALPPEKTRGVGNAAGMGAAAALLSRDVQKRAAALDVRYVELSSSPLFGGFFMDAMMFDTLLLADVHVDA